MIASIRIAASRCTCELCGWEWISIAQAVPPIACPHCKCRVWNGPKRNGRPPVPRDTSHIGLPKPHRVRLT
jgi:DNA-directed RNA polymerase subunit RPC12/RpoP